MADDLVSGAIAAAVYGETSGAECPVRCLGYRDGTYFFVSPSGEKRALSARDFYLSSIISLFDGEIDWPAREFPPAGGGKGAFDMGHVTAYLMHACVEAGMWDDSAPTRSIGTWATNAGEIVVHCGDAVWWRDAWHRAGLEIDGVVYPAAPRIARPDFAAMPTAGDIRGLLVEPSSTWRYRDPLGARRALGWLGAAYYGAAPAWRNHAVARGPRGCGKSSLAVMLNAALGPASDRIQTDTSEAGLRQALGGEARAIMLDEAEGDDGGAGGGGIEKIIKLVRQMSSGEGASTRRGSSGGRAVEFRLVGATWLSAIQPPAMTPQDRSRFVVIDLLPLDAAIALPDYAGAVQRLSAAAPGLWARMITGWARFRDAFGLYRGELVRRGCDFRQADLVATWAAGCDILTSDELLEGEAVDGDVDTLMPYVTGLVEDDREDGEGEQCLSHLLTSSVDAWASGVKKTLGALLQEAIHQDMPDALVALRQVGIRVLRVSPDKDRANAVRVFVVANKHAALDRVFTGTRWSGGRWKNALLMMDGTFMAPAPVRFTGSEQSRAAAVPVERVPRDFDGADGEQHDNGAGIPEIGEVSP